MPGGWTWACDSGWVEWISSSPGLDWEGGVGVSLGVDAGGGAWRQKGEGGMYPFASHVGGDVDVDLMVVLGGDGR